MFIQSPKEEKHGHIRLPSNVPLVDWPSDDDTGKDRPQYVSGNSSDHDMCEEDVSDPILRQSQTV